MRNGEDSAKRGHRISRIIFTVHDNACSIPRHFSWRIGLIVLPFHLIFFFIKLIGSSSKEVFFYSVQFLLLLNGCRKEIFIFYYLHQHHHTARVYFSKFEIFVISKRSLLYCWGQNFMSQRDQPKPGICLMTTTISPQLLLNY